MTSATLNDVVLMGIRTKRAVRDFKPKLWLDGGRVPTNLVPNGGFETAPGTGANIFGSWSDSIAGGSTVSIDTTTPDSGTNACKLNVVSGAVCTTYQTVLTVGTRYTLRFRAKASAAGKKLTVGNVGGDLTFTLAATWGTHEATFTAAQTQLAFKRYDGDTHTLYIDNVTLWKSAETPVDAATIPQWTSRDVSHVAFARTSVASHPTYTADTKSVTFDGTDDYLTKATVTLTGTAGRVAITCSTGEVDELQVLYSQSDTATATHYLHLGVNDSNVMYYAFNDGGTVKVLTGNAALGTDMHILEWVSDGTTITMFVDGSEQIVTEGTEGDNAGDWFGDVTGADNSTIGASIDDTGTAENPFTGTIEEIVALEPDDTASNVTRLRQQLARLAALTLASGIGLVLADGSGILLADGSGLLL